MATNPKTCEWYECKEKIKITVCPITNGLPTAMYRRTFAEMCLKYQNGEVRIPSGMGRNVASSAVEKLLPCGDCKRGKMIAKGKRWQLPRECKSIRER